MIAIPPAAVKAVLTGLLLLAAPTLEDCGGPPSSGGGGRECYPFCPVEQQQQQQADDGCPPPVAWIKPGAGTVQDVMVCPALFGDEIHYILVDSGPRQVWLSDPGGSCRVGSDWGPVSC